MASNSHRKSNSSARSRSRKKVYLSPGPTPRDQVVPPVSGRVKDSASSRDRGKSRRKGGRIGEQLSRNKRQQREERLAGLRRRIKAKWAGLAAAILAVVVGVVWLYNSQVFPIDRVEVAGNRRLTSEQVVALARVPADATLLRFSGRAVRARVEASPWVAEAIVTRDFPDGVLVRIVERTPVVRLDHGGKYWWLDGGGVVLGTASVEDTAALPVLREVDDISPKPGVKLRSDELDNALQILEGISPSLRRSVRSISAPSIDRTAVYTSDSIEIFFGEAVDLDKKDLVARRIMRQEKGKVVSINVRSLKAPTWHGLEP